MSKAGLIGGISAVLVLWVALLLLVFAPKVLATLGFIFLLALLSMLAFFVGLVIVEGD